jgi:hypothetical protein
VEETRQALTGWLYIARVFHNNCTTVVGSGEARMKNYMACQASSTINSHESFNLHPFIYSLLSSLSLALALAHFYHNVDDDDDDGGVEMMMLDH